MFNCIHRLHPDGKPPSGLSREELFELTRQSAFALTTNTVVLDDCDNEMVEENEHENDEHATIHIDPLETPGRAANSNLIDNAEPLPSSVAIKKEPLLKKPVVDNRWKTYWPPWWYAWLCFGAPSENPHHIWNLKTTNGPEAEPVAKPEALFQYAKEEQDALQRRKIDLQLKALDVQEKEASSLALNAAANKRKLDLIEQKMSIDNLKELLAMESGEEEEKILKKEIKALLRK